MRRTQQQQRRQPDDPNAGKTAEEIAAEAERKRKAEEARKLKAAKDAERAELRRQVRFFHSVYVA